MNLLRALVENLQSQVNTHKELLAALEDEISLPASCTLDQLQEAQSERDRSVKQIRALELARQEIIRNIAREKKIKGEVSLRVIMGFCEEKVSQILSEYRNTLLHIVDKIRKSSREAAEKAILRSNCIKEVHNAIHKRFKRETYYSITGKLAQPKGACILQKAI